MIGMSSRVRVWVLWLRMGFSIMLMGGFGVMVINDTFWWVEFCLGQVGDSYFRPSFGLLTF